MSIELKGTTICAVCKDGKIAIAGDGQVTMGERVIFKSNARKVRRLYGVPLWRWPSCGVVSRACGR